MIGHTRRNQRERLSLYRTRLAPEVPSVMPYQSCPGCGVFLFVGEGRDGGPHTCERCGHVFAPPARRPGGRRSDASGPAPAKRGGRSVLLTLGIVLGCVVLVCAGLGTLGYFVFIHEIEEPVTAADREIPITAE